VMGGEKKEGMGGKKGVPRRGRKGGLKINHMGVKPGKISADWLRK